MEEGHLGGQVEAAMLRNVHEEQDGCRQMRQSRDGGHLNTVAILQRMIQDAGSINHLPLHVVVVQMTNEQGLGGESIRLDIHIGIGDNVHERGLPNVGVACQNQCPCCRIDRWQSAQVLSHLFQEGQGALELFDRGRHPAERSTFQHLALIQAVGKFHHLDVFFGNPVHHLFARVHLSQSQFEVIAIVQHIAEISVEGMDVIDLGKLFEDFGEFLVVTRLTELHLSHVEVPDSSNLKAWMHHCGCLALGLREHNIHQLFCWRYGLNLLELVHGAKGASGTATGISRAAEG
mmetsp:Transcript_9043/g.20113  ORF Transcript_9043/g.20113 Transcript_9043/m.20113 type:complete len:290 (-) Transcript_9043:7-876(-)